MNFLSCCTRKRHNSAVSPSAEEFNRGNEIHDNYIIGRNPLGSGSFGLVYPITHKRTGKKYALKLIPWSTVTRGNQSIIMREMDVLASLNHANIVKLYKAYSSNIELGLVMELASGGDLFKSLTERGSFSEQDASMFVKQVLEALAYLHDRCNIVHRDIKPENILLKSIGNNEIVLSDFGLAKVIGNNEMLSTMCGTPGFVAPELINNNGHGKAADMWSVGCTAYMLLCGEPPFVGDSMMEVLNKICVGKFSFEGEHWATISDSAKDFIRKLLLVDPNSRMNASHALKHTWITTESPLIDLLPVVKANLKKRFKTVAKQVAIVNAWQKSVGSKANLREQ